MSNESLSEKLVGTVVAGISGGLLTFLGSMGAGQYGLMEKTGGISSTYATDMDAAMDFAFGPGKYIIGGCLAVGLIVDGYRAFQRARE